MCSLCWSKKELELCILMHFTLASKSPQLYRMSQVHLLDALTVPSLTIHIVWSPKYHCKVVLLSFGAFPLVFLKEISCLIHQLPSQLQQNKAFHMMCLFGLKSLFSVHRDYFFTVMLVRGQDSDKSVSVSLLFLISDRKKMGNASYLFERWEMDEKKQLIKSAKCSCKFII